MDSDALAGGDNPMNPVTIAAEPHSLTTLSDTDQDDKTTSIAVQDTDTSEAITVERSGMSLADIILKDVLDETSPQTSQVRHDLYDADTFSSSVGDVGITATSKELVEDVPSDDPVNLKRRQRSNLFREGLKLLQTPENTDKALSCFVAAITGLTEKESFRELPQCLHQISNIYFEKKEYDKAVHFIQAEKMYYETALIDIANLQQQLESERKEKFEVKGAEEQTLTTKGSDSPEIIKAKEYENLARLCLQESKPQLALEYCGKATKVYRQVYGDDHPITIGSLDLFTMIYADVGKKLYADAMRKFDLEEKAVLANAAQPPSEDANQKSTAGNESTSQLRKRSKKETEQLVDKPCGQTENRTEQARTEFEPTPQAEEQDDYVTTFLLMLLFFLITVFILLVMSYFYCLGNERTPLCHQLKGDLSYWYMRIRHFNLGLGRR